MRKYEYIFLHMQLSNLTFLAQGYYAKPTVFTDVQDDSKINQEEIFGPVAVLHKFNTEEEVLKRCVRWVLLMSAQRLNNGIEYRENDTEYSLAA